MTYATLKSAVINAAKGTIAQLPYCSVERSAHKIIFDLQENESIELQIDFLKNTKLSEIQYLETSPENAAFKMKNTRTGNFIHVSNRDCRHMELRGEYLRKLLDEQKKDERTTFKEEKEDPSVYDIMTKITKSPEHSDIGAGLKMACCGTTTEQVTNMEQQHGVAMSEIHFKLFTLKLLEKLQKKISQKSPQAEVDPHEIPIDETLRESIWEGINISKIFDETYLTAHFQPIKDASETLRRQGHIHAADNAINLYALLAFQQGEFINGNITVEELNRNCTKFLQDAQKDNIFYTIVQAILSALNFISGGRVPMIPTKPPLKTTSEIIGAMQFFSPEERPKRRSVGLSGEHSPLRQPSPPPPEAKKVDVSLSP